MTQYDRLWERNIDTPLGTVVVTQKLWDMGEESENWTVVQELNPEYPRHRSECDVQSGEVVGHFLKQFAVAQELANAGYELHSQIDGERLLWVNYTQKD